MPLFHTKHNLLENWNKPEVKEIVDKALGVKSEINKLTSQNTWLSNATVIVNSQDFEILSVRLKLFIKILKIFTFN